jgi:phytoene dehydrogenase-like protein
VPSSYYDVIVLGADLAPLFCSALLARRGYRVLVLGHEYLSPSYIVGGHRFAAYPFSFVGAQSPVGRRLYSELGLTQRFRRIAPSAQRRFQIALPGHRFDISSDQAAMDRELGREFPNLKRPIEEFHQNIAHLYEQFDQIAARPMIWPPEGFWERRGFTRAIASMSFDRLGRGRDLLSECSEDHPFRLAARLPSYFASDVDPEQLSAFCVYRLYAHWLQGALAPEGGVEALRDLLFEKIKSHSGIVRLDERVREVLTRRGAVCGVKLDASSDEIGCHTVIAGIDLSGLLHLLPDRAPFEELFERMGEPQLRYYRYTLNLVVDAKGIPAGMARDLFYLRRMRMPTEAEDLLSLQLEPVDAERYHLCVEALIPRRKLEDVSGYLGQTREAILASLSELAPFIREHLIAIDSPHDGRPPEIKQATAPFEPSAQYRYRRGPDTMSGIYYYPVLSGLGACALPIRTPVRRLFLCNRQVVPGLGLEGSLMTAWSAAQTAMRADRSKKWLFSGLWTKVEI